MIQPLATTSPNRTSLACRTFQFYESLFVLPNRLRVFLTHVSLLKESYPALQLSVNHFTMQSVGSYLATQKTNSKADSRPGRFRQVAIHVSKIVIFGLLSAALALALFAGVIVLVVRHRVNQELSLLEPSGPYAVGRLTFDWTDNSRRDPFSNAIGTHRELVVWVWYPAKQTPEARSAGYVTEGWEELVRSPVRTRPQKVRVHALDEAPPSPVGKPYPVLILSPGFGRVATDYTSLTEELASNGYVVLGIANTYSAPAVRFPDGRVAYGAPEAVFPETTEQADQAAGDRIAGVWASDALFALSQLAQLNSDHRSYLYGVIDVQKAGFLGHSFGGAASAEACALDSRCKAGVDIDGDLFGEAWHRGVRQPFLFLLSDNTIDPSWFETILFRQGANERQSRDAQFVQQVRKLCARSSDCWFTRVRGARHFNFSDDALLVQFGGRPLGFLGPVDGREGLRTAAGCIRAFFDMTLSGRGIGAGDSDNKCSLQPLDRLP